MAKLYDTLNQALLELTQTLKDVNVPNLQDPWEWANNQTSSHWLWQTDPILQLRFMLAQYQHDEQNLRHALRTFLKNRYKGKHNFTKEPLDLFCIKIAEEIAKKDEPIISLLIPELDKNAKYTVNDYEQITLTCMTEYLDFRTDKKRLKDLTQFIVSEDRKRVIGCIRCCESALATGEFADATQSNAYQKPTLTAREQIYLARWDSISQECIDCNPTQSTADESIQVTQEFYNKYKNLPKNTLYYEFALLIECLLNGGVTRTSENNHNLAPKEIAEMGIARFKKVWFSLRADSWFSRLLYGESKGDALGQKKCPTFFNDEYILGALLFRLFSQEQLTENLTSKESDFFVMSKKKPYVNFSCVESMAHSKLMPFLQLLENDLKEIIIKPPTQPVIVIQAEKTKARGAISARLQQKFFEANPLETADNIEDFVQCWTRKLSLVLDEWHIKQLGYIIKTPDNLKELNAELQRTVGVRGSAYRAIYRILEQQGIEKFKTCCSLEVLDELLECEYKAEKEAQSSWFREKYDRIYKNEHINAIVDDKDNKEVTKSRLYFACENKCKYLILYLLSMSRDLIYDLREVNPNTDRSPVDLMVADKDLFSFILNEESLKGNIETLWDVTSQNYIKSKRSLDRNILAFILEIKGTPSLPLVSWLNDIYLSMINLWPISRPFKALGYTRQEDLEFRRLQEEGYKKYKAKIVSAFITYIKFANLTQLVILSKLMTMIQATDSRSEIESEGITYDCTLFQHLRKETIYPGYGNTNSWQQVINTLQEQIKLRFQAGLMGTDNNIQQNCVKVLQLHSDRGLHLTTNNQQWIDNNLKISATSVSLKS